MGKAVRGAVSDDFVQTPVGDALPVGGPAQYGFGQVERAAAGQMGVHVHEPRQHMGTAVLIEDLAATVAGGGDAVAAQMQCRMGCG
ncbi:MULTISPECIES: hypothetical protein [unclassified Streptomyces]|uniref:hypothetical protein n=1 Tax=unclassified Streptomyces TaxID=2593676 RepID=UPI003D8CA936